MDTFTNCNYYTGAQMYTFGHMPCIKIMFDIWVCFPKLFVNLLIPACHKHISDKVMALKKFNAALEALW